jgi:type IV pilus assembly protein PilE
MDYQRRITRSRGVTLVELMIVVAVISILAAIAYPAYTENALKGKRASAKARMTEVAQRLQVYYSEHGSSATYTTTLTELNYPAGTLQSEAKGHNITVAAGADGIATTYKITATPVATDARCGNLTLDHLGTMLPVDC